MLNRIEIFCHVYEERSFSKAARRLEISQPTVSVQIKALEECLGVSLFNRLGRRIEPTEAGHVLFEQGRSLLELKRNLLARMGRLLEEPEGPLAVGASTIPADYLLPPLLARFRQEHPRVQIQVQVDPTRGIVEAVRQGVVPLGLVGGQLSDPHLEYRPVATDRLVLVAGGSSPAAPRSTLTLDELREVPLVVRESGSGTRMFLEQSLAEEGLHLDELRVVAELGSNSSLKEAVKAGVGLGFLSDLSVVTERRMGLLSALQVQGLPAMEREFFFVLDGRRAIPAIIEAFIEYLELEPVA